MLVKRALLVTTVSGFVPQFEMNSVLLLQENGYEVHYATNYNYVFYGKDNSRLDGTGIIRHQIDFARSPYSKQTLTAYRQLDKLLTEIDFDVIHCHTPIGGILARIAGKKHNVPHVLYTAHGFHFYKGAPKINWIVYYNAEKIMAHYTDALITINNEDFANAQKFKTKRGGQVYQIAGAGIDTKRFRQVSSDRRVKRNELGIENTDFFVLSVGELNKNKNHETVIQGLSKVEHSGIKYRICGDGIYKDELQKLIRDLNMEDCVRLLGYRTDIPEISHAADLFVFPSYREGLPVSMMEAMASGLPVVASSVRGNVDLIVNGENGFLLDPLDDTKWGQLIAKMKGHSDKCKKMGEKNKQKMLSYDKEEVRKQLAAIYREQGII